MFALKHRHVRLLYAAQDVVVQLGSGSCQDTKFQSRRPCLPHPAATIPSPNLALTASAYAGYLPPCTLQPGDKMKVMILSMDKDRGRVTLSTKKLEKEPGDMLRDPQLVFEGAEAMAAEFRERVGSAEGNFMDDDLSAAQGFAAAPAAGQAPAGQQQQYAFDTPV